MRPAIMLAALSALAGCEADPPPLDWQLVLGEGATDEGAVVVAVQISQTPCAEDCAPDQPCNRYVATLTLGSDGYSTVPAGGQPPPPLPRGAYAFRATLLDARCEVVALGCADVHVPDDIVVVLSSPATVACACPPDECEGGFCTSGGRSACSCAPPTSELDCNDDIDDDCDGDTDCRDLDCTEVTCGAGPVCRNRMCVPPTEDGLCNDEIDNDLDSLVDCADTTDCPPFESCGTNRMCCGDRCVAIDTKANCGMCGLRCDGGAQCRTRAETGLFVCRGCGNDADCPAGWVCQNDDCECRDDQDCCRGEEECNLRWQCNPFRENRHCTEVR